MSKPLSKILDFKFIKVLIKVFVNLYAKTFVKNFRYIKEKCFNCKSVVKVLIYFTSR